MMTLWLIRIEDWLDTGFRVRESSEELFDDNESIIIHSRKSSVTKMGEEDTGRLKYLTYSLLQAAVCNGSQLLPESLDKQSEIKLVDGKVIYNTVKYVFSSIEALNKSFLATEDQKHPSGIDIYSVRKSYQLILKLHPKDQSILPLSNGLEILLGKLEMNSMQVNDIPSMVLRPLLIALEVKMFIATHFWAESIIT
jgi:hypothetical protein